MRITSVSFGRTRNLGDYNSVKGECTVELAEGEDAAEAAKMAKAFVLQELGLGSDGKPLPKALPPPPAPVTPPVRTPEPVAPAPAGMRRRSSNQ